MYSLLLLDAPDKERSRMGSTSDAKILKTILQSFSTLTLVNKCIVAFNKISYECNKMHRNKLPGTLIFKIFPGEHPIPLCRRGCSAPAHYPTRPPLSWRNSAPATLQFPPATFFQFENPGYMIYTNYVIRTQALDGDTLWIINKLMNYLDFFYCTCSIVPAVWSRSTQ